jgi:Zn-dependent M28 family amino/carboxypeptidase
MSGTCESRPEDCHCSRFPDAARGYVLNDKMLSQSKRHMSAAQLLAPWAQAYLHLHLPLDPDPLLWHPPAGAASRGAWHAARRAALQQSSGEVTTMTAMSKWWKVLAGQPLDPLAPGTRHAIAVMPLLAWVGLGADGLSSSCYGP